MLTIIVAMLALALFLFILGVVLAAASVFYLAIKVGLILLILYGIWRLIQSLFS